jgi:hypothetical protein
MGWQQAAPAAGRRPSGRPLRAALGELRPAASQSSACAMPSTSAPRQATRPQRAPGRSQPGRWRTPFTRPAWNAASPSPRTLSGHSSGSGRASRSRSGSRRCRPLLGDPPPSPRAIRPHAVPYVGATCPSPVWWPHRYLRPRDRRKAHTGHNETVPRRSGRHLPSSPFKPPPGDPPARQYANWVIS